MHESFDMTQRVQNNQESVKRTQRLYKNHITHGVAVQKEETMSISALLHGQVEGMRSVQIGHFLYGSQEDRTICISAKATMWWKMGKD